MELKVQSRIKRKCGGVETRTNLSAHFSHRCGPQQPSRRCPSFRLLHGSLVQWATVGHVLKLHLLVQRITGRNQAHSSCSKEEPDLLFYLVCELVTGDRARERQRKDSEKSHKVLNTIVHQHTCALSSRAARVEGLSLGTSSHTGCHSTRRSRPWGIAWLRDKQKGRRIKVVSTDFSFLSSVPQWRNHEHTAASRSNRLWRKNGRAATRA